MSTAEQLLSRILADALTGVAERLADYNFEVADLRSLGVEDVLRIAFDAASRVHNDADTGEHPIFTPPPMAAVRPPAGTWDDEITERIGVKNRGKE